jgi:hypothetical protein
MEVFHNKTPRRTASIDEYQSFDGYPQFLLINNAVVALFVLQEKAA